METNPPDRAQMEQKLSESVLRIEALEKAFAGAEHKVQKYVQENELLHGQLKGLQEEFRHSQHDYESLRIQKGGFGFKTLMASGLAATLVGFIFCYLFFRPKDEHTETFRRFRQEHQFNIEYAIGQGQFELAENALKESLEKPENALIRPEIELNYKIVSAAKRRCGNK